MGRALGKRLFEEVREGSMTEIMKERGRDGIPRRLRADALGRGQLALQFPQAIDEPRHHVGRAQRVREASVVRPWVNERRQTELTNVPKTLHLVGVDQLRNDGGVVRFERDQPVDWVAQDHDCRSELAGDRCDVHPQS